jgi:hypothetical protein
VCHIHLQFTELLDVPLRKVFILMSCPVEDGFQFLAGAMVARLSLHHLIQTSSGAHLASFPVDIGALSPEVKQPGHEADYSPASSAEVKNAWSCTSTPPLHFHGMVLKQWMCLHGLVHH